MALIPWKPFSDLDKFFDDDDWFLSRAAKPEMDIYETEKEVIAELNLPGFDPEKISVSMEKGVLHVSGDTEEKKEEEKKDYWRKEIRTGSFERMVRIPSPVQEDAVDATYEKGVLKIRMPKTEGEQPPKVQIKIKEK